MMTAFVSCFVVLSCLVIHITPHDAQGKFFFRTYQICSILDKSIILVFYFAYSEKSPRLGIDSDGIREINTHLSK